MTVGRLIVWFLKSGVRLLMAMIAAVGLAAFADAPLWAAIVGAWVFLIYLEVC